MKAPPAVEPDVRDDLERRARQPREGVRAPGVMVAPEFRQKPLTKVVNARVLQLISQGYSNKQGALRIADQPAQRSRVIGRRPCASLARETPRIWFAPLCCTPSTRTTDARSSSTNRRSPASGKARVNAPQEFEAFAYT